MGFRIGLQSDRGLIMLQNGLFLASPLLPEVYYRGSYVFYLALFILFQSPDLLHGLAAFSSFFQKPSAAVPILLWLLQWKRESGGTSVRP